MRTLDPGQITEDSAGYAVLSLVVTLIGLLIVSTLISLINNRIERRVEGVRRGRDPVDLPGGHIAVLGWSDIGTKVIEELAEAVPDGRRPEVVVVAPRSVQDLRHELIENEVLGRIARHWPLLRSGTAWDTRDLKLLGSVHNARCVVVLHDDDGEGVADTVKTVMAVVAACEGPKDAANMDDQPTLVLEVPEDSEGTVRQLVQRLKRFGFRVLAVDSGALRTELAAQVTRRAGLSDVFRDLLNFAGDELYLANPPAHLVTFGEAVVSLTRTVPIGLIRSGDHRMDLWPEWGERLEGSQLVVVGRDLGASLSCATGASMGTVPAGQRPRCSVRGLERQDLLLVGWNDGACHLVEVLDQYAGPASTLTIVTDRALTTSLPGALKNLTATSVIELSGGLQEWLDAERDHYDHAVVLSDDDKSAAASDAATFLTLLALRPAGLEHGNPTTVVAQLRERASKHLARQSLADDVVVGDALTATAIAQLTMAPALEPVLQELIGPTPFALDIVAPAALDLEGVVSFADVSLAAMAAGEIALGWRKIDGAVVLNPAKGSSVSTDEVVGIVLLTRVSPHGGPADVLHRSQGERIALSHRNPDERRGDATTVPSN